MNERFTTLDQVVRDICEIGGNDLDHKNYGRVLKLCVQTLRSYNLYNSTPYTKTEDIEILPNNTARLPKNALSVLRVGYTDRCGRIHEIFHNKNLSLADKYINEPCKCGDKMQVIETIGDNIFPIIEDWIEINYTIGGDVEFMNFGITTINKSLELDSINYEDNIVTFEIVKNAIDNFTSNDITLSYTNDGKIRATRKTGYKGYIILGLGSEIDLSDKNINQKTITSNNPQIEITYIPSPSTMYYGTSNTDTESQEIQVSKWVDVKMECDDNGKCKSCGGHVPFGIPSYSYGYNGGWYSTAYLYSRELAQANINIPNAGQVFYEAYAAKPYPAWYGYYNVDLKNGVIRLSNKFNHQLNDKVTVVYSTDMVEVEGAKVVAVEWFDMLLYRCKEMYWSLNSVDSQRNRQLYERERTRIIKIYNRQTMEEWTKAIMEVKYSGVKR